MRKAHSHAKCDEEEWVELPGDVGMGPVRKAAKMAIWYEESGGRLGGGVFQEAGGGRIQARSRSSHGIHEQEDRSSSGRAWR